MLHTVNSFYLEGTKFHGLMMDMFMETKFIDFQIKPTTIKLNQ